MSDEVDVWTRELREGWLADHHGVTDKDGVKRLPKSSGAWKLVNAIRQVLSNDIAPTQTAADISSIVLSQSDVGKTWRSFIAIYLSATRQISNRHALQRLVDLLVTLASLPDAVRTMDPEEFTDDGNGNGIGNLDIDAEEVIYIGRDKLWIDVPDFNWNLTEQLQGPEADILSLHDPATPEEAMARWTNIQTYLALLAIHPDAQRIPALAGKIVLGLRELAIALEHDPATRSGKYVYLRFPAVRVWLSLAGRQLEFECGKSARRFPAGELWSQGRGGSDVCDSERFHFWRERVRTIMDDADDDNAVGDPCYVS